jgi:hypothetical protein
MAAFDSAHEPTIGVEGILLGRVRLTRPSDEQNLVARVLTQAVSSLDGGFGALKKPEGKGYRAGQGL